MMPMAAGKVSNTDFQRRAAIYIPEFLCGTRKSTNDRVLKLMSVTNDLTNGVF